MKKITTKTNANDRSEFIDSVQSVNVLNPINVIGKRTFLIKMNAIILLLALSCLQAFGQNSNALHFNNSTNNYVTIPDAAQLHLGTGKFTIEALVKMPTGQSSLSTILSKRIDNSTTSAGFTLFIQNGQIRFQIRGINTNPVGPDLRDDSCHHVAIVRDSVGKVTGYVDGVAYTMATINNQNMTNTDPIYLGWDDAEPASSQYLGTLDEVRIWNVIRTSAQINTFKNTGVTTGGGLVAYYKFNQGTAGSNNSSVTSLRDEVSVNNGSFTGFTMNGNVSNFVKSCIQEKTNCDYFKLAANDTNCCSAGLVRTMAGGSNVLKVRFNITGGVVQGYTTNCTPSTPTSAWVSGRAAWTINFSGGCNMQFFNTSLQSTTASGSMVASYTIIFANGDSCTYKTDVKGCHRAPVSRCDRLAVSPYTYPGLDLSGRRFTIYNLKVPASPICKILISLSPVPSTLWQGGSLSTSSSGLFIPGTYFAAPYTVIPSGSGTPWNNFSPNTLNWVRFNLGVDFTISWSGTVYIKVIHCDGDTCPLFYNWNATRSAAQQPFTTAQKLNDSLFAVSLSLGLPTVKNKTIKWLGVEVTKDNSEIFSITGGRYEVEKKNDSSRLPLSSSEQSSSFALFELDNNMKLDGSDSQLPINMVFKGKRPSLHLTGYDENGNEVISDTFTVRKNVAGVYQMVKSIENKIGIIAYPNPSASEVTLSYFIEDASDVEFTVFDISGSFIKTYAQGKKRAGNYEFKIDNSSLATGTYIVKMKTEKYTKSVIIQVAK